ncbi:hypothetical protein ACFQ0K_07420 [Nocardioides caeni]|uniref:Gram-positive cocci surface proteins LPxTG domain-containing protein n=1 Tax=Nocardioides caeni TaxID=574700 RepID=A0A4V4HJ43_9ACTN|nr:hypothetical protein [Nocardioides caeni]THV09096.1 hypothetical protein E9934_17470 [Nocardioides caeni]
MSRRHLPALSLVAVAAFGLGAPGAALAAPDPVPGEVLPMISAECGQDAVYDTIVHPAVVEQVPAVTHLEWVWSRLVPTTEVLHERTVAPAQGTWAWSREVDVVEEQYAVRVVDAPAVPAVPEVGHWESRVVTPAVTVVMWEYAHLHNGNTRWEREGWNAGANGLGWSPTGNTRVDVLEPEVTEQVWVVDQAAVPAAPEQAHDELSWVALGAPGPAGGTFTGVTRVAGTTTEHAELPDGDSPLGSGWLRGVFTETAAAIVEELWLPEGTAPEAGYVATGTTRPGAAAEETTGGTSAAAPAGAGWSPVAGSEVTVVDAAATEIEIEPAWVEDFILSPATDPCPVAEETDVDGVDGAVDDNTDTAVQTGVEGLVEAATTGATAEAGVLPATGAPVGLWGVALGAGGVVGGVALVARSRRRPA